MNDIIQKGVEICGSQIELAKACDVSHTAVRKWLNGGEYSAKYAYRIEKATNGLVTSSELCQALDELDRK
ncbi:transcriptional regulator [Lonepinella sp. BR2357]|uniref:transcriptional regulator n=1 Tax=Lonepinella sp. BR2357 TaxID=3434549 RepID=UPI003F6E21C6